ncbi:hypothetical protein CGCVW01_v008332 [Colletotrichum viniferum]|nr:hypothetical protein CGCVW01_v008332 [Colletotrichum viniferum]
MSQTPSLAVQPVALDHQRLFYEPVVLEYALQIACRGGREVFNETPIMENDSLTSQKQAFHCFVDKLAQVCDNERGGKMVTAVAVLNGSDQTEFVFASNERTEDELAETRDFLHSLLTLVGKNPAGLKPKPLTKQVLWKILHFNMLRLNDYLNKLIKYLNKCIADCDRRQLTGTLKSELEKLREKADFPRDSGAVQDKILSDCEKLIKGVVAIKSSSIEVAIKDHAKDGSINSSESWCELRHYLGRLLSFRQAANVIVDANDRDPDMLRSFNITSVSSSPPGPKPIGKSRSFTAVSIVNNMITEDDEEKEDYLEKALEMQRFGVNDIIYAQISKRSFKPRVHAEIQVHDYLLDNGLQHPREYWNSWKYIGSSKPTCKLCHYYFDLHPDKVSVRKPHFNLYPNWRLPGLLESQDSETGPDPKKLRLLQQMTERIRDDVKTTLEERRPVGRTHDSLTSTTRPPGLAQTDEDSDSISISGLAIQPSTPSVRAQDNSGSSLWPGGDDDQESTQWENESEFTEEANEGVSVVDA